MLNFVKDELNLRLHRYYNMLCETLYFIKFKAKELRNKENCMAILVFLSTYTKHNFYTLNKGKLEMIKT